ncbi:collagen alpha-1(III) chain-like, partial [Panthera uncia]|uniref:collagen alpha-1(III) chain-like n=1 Tax=Panthera uncia TaxID=29064 RepID=UPI0020FFD0B9
FEVRQIAGGERGRGRGSGPRPHGRGPGEEEGATAGPPRSPPGARRRDQRRSGSAPPPPTTARGTARHGPPQNPPETLAAIPKTTPRPTPHHTGHRRADPAGRGGGEGGAEGGGGDRTHRAGEGGREEEEGRRAGSGGHSRLHLGGRRARRPGRPSPARRRPRTPNRRAGGRGAPSGRGGRWRDRPCKGTPSRALPPGERPTRGRRLIGKRRSDRRCLRLASKRQQRPDSERSEGLEQGKSSSPPRHADDARGARNNPTGAQGVPACPLPPTHTQGTRGARTRTRSRTTRQPPGKPPPGKRGGPWRGRKRGGTPAWGGGGRAAESGGDTGRPASAAPHGPDRPDPQRVFKPPRRDALGTWTGWRRARWVGDEGARDTANHLDAGTPPPGAAAGPTNGKRKPRRCRPVTEAPTGANRPPPQTAAARRPSLPPTRPPHDPSSPPPSRAAGADRPRPRPHFRAHLPRGTDQPSPSPPPRPRPPPPREGGCGGKRGTSGEGGRKGVSKVCGVGQRERAQGRKTGLGDGPPTERRAIQGGRREAADGGAPRVSRGSKAPRDGREPDRGDTTRTRRHATHPETRRGQGASAGGAATGLRPAPKAKAEGEHTRTPPTLRPTSAGEGEARHGGGWKRTSRVGERRAKARQGRRGTPQRLPRASRRRPPPFPPLSSDRHTPNQGPSTPSRALSSLATSGPAPHRPARAARVAKARKRNRGRAPTAALSR